MRKECLGGAPFFHFMKEIRNSPYRIIISKL